MRRAIFGLVGALIVTVAPAAHGASVTGTHKQTAARQVDSPIVQLITGDRVQLRERNGRLAPQWLPVERHGIAGQVQVVTMKGHTYAIPGAAAPYLGALLDVSLFDVTALAKIERGGRLPIRVSYKGGARSAVPGLTVTGHSGRTDTGYFTAASARTFGRALVAQWTSERRASGPRAATAVLLDGVARIGLDAPSTAVARPHYPQVTLIVKMRDSAGKPVYLKDIWPTPQEIESTVRASVTSSQYSKQYSEVFEGDAHWKSMPIPKGDIYKWDPKSTYIKLPPYFDNMPKTPPALADIHGAKVLAILGDSVTTDHISPAGSIPIDSPAGKYLIANGVKPHEFNSYGARRGNHEVMMRGTFANIRLRNQLAPGTEGGWTLYLPDGEKMSIYDAAVKYREAGVPLVVLAGKEYGSGSSRDWAAKGTRLLGVRAVIAESYERIHRSNLVGMGVLPLEFKAGENRETLGLTGHEIFDIEDVASLTPKKQITVHAKSGDGRVKTFSVIARADTPEEVSYYHHGGILQYVLRQML